MAVNGTETMETVIGLLVMACGLVAAWSGGRYLWLRLLGHETEGTLPVALFMVLFGLSIALWGLLVAVGVMDLDDFRSPYENPGAP